MEFNFSADQMALQDMARTFTEKEAVPRAAYIDKESHFPQELFEMMMAQGFTGLYTPEEYGGSGG